MFIAAGYIQQVNSQNVDFFRVEGNDTRTVQLLILTLKVQKSATILNTSQIYVPSSPDDETQIVANNISIFQLT